MYIQDQIVIVRPVEKKYTREDLMILFDQMMIELDKINSILDECFKKCQEQLDRENGQDS